MKPCTELEIRILSLTQKSEVGEVGLDIRVGPDWEIAIQHYEAMQSLCEKGLLYLILNEVDTNVNEPVPVRHLRYRLTEKGKQFLHDSLQKIIEDKK